LAVPTRGKGNRKDLHCRDAQHVYRLCISLRNIRSIRARSKPLPALPAKQYTLLTLYLVPAHDCTTLARHTCHDRHVLAPHDLCRSLYCCCALPVVPTPPVTFTSRRRTSRSTHHHTHDMSYQTVFA